MEHHKTNKSVVRIQGSVEQDKLKKATEAFLKKAQQYKEGKKNEKTVTVDYFGDSVGSDGKTIGNS